MSKPIHPGEFDLRKQMEDREDFSVFNEVFPRVMPVSVFAYKIQRMCVDEGREFTDILAGLCKEYGLSSAISIEPERRRCFFATLMYRWEQYEKSNGNHNGECC